MHCAHCDERRIVTNDSAAWRMLQPSRFGGQVISLDEYVTTVGALAATDGSAGWLCAVLNAAAHEVACLPGDVAERIWGADPAAVVTAGWVPNGQLERNGSELRLTGRWDGVAGVEVADWFLLAAADNGAACRALVPRAAIDVEPVSGRTGLPAAGIGAVSVSALPITGRQVLPAGCDVAGGAGAAAAVVGAANGLWHAHVAQVRERLAASYGSAEVSDQMVSTRQVARTASDIDAAMLQVAASLSENPPAAARSQQQAVSRARDAADQLLGSGRRHALDASDPVSRFWLDVHTGCRLVLRQLGQRFG